MAKNRSGGEPDLPGGRMRVPHAGRHASAAAALAGDTAGTFAGEGRTAALSGELAALESRLLLGEAPVYVVAVEYCGTHLLPYGGAARRPVTEHAYDVAAATFAHEDQSTRVGFPEPVRGWPSRPCAPRCRACTNAVNVAVTGVIERAFAGLADRAQHLPAPGPHVQLRAEPRRGATQTAADLGAPGDGTAGVAEARMIPAAAVGVDRGGHPRRRTGGDPATVTIADATTAPGGR